MASIPQIALSAACGAACNTDGQLEIFGVGTDFALWHIWQTAPHAGPWSAWSSLAGGITSKPAVAVNKDGRLEVFVRGTDGALWHICKPRRMPVHGLHGVRWAAASPAIQRSRRTRPAAFMYSHAALTALFGT
jgi:hypothetical protein